MYKVKKGNRILTVNETEKAFYLSEGYDVVELNDDGNYEVTEKATGGRTYTTAEYNAVVKKCDDLVVENEKFIKEREELEAQIIELKSKIVETPKEFNRQEAIETLKEKNVEFKGNASNDELKKLLEENA